MYRVVAALLTGGCLVAASPAFANDVLLSDADLDSVTAGVTAEDLQGFLDAAVANLGFFTPADDPSDDPEEPSGDGGGSVVGDTGGRFVIDFDVFASDPSELLVATARAFNSTSAMAMIAAQGVVEGENGSYGINGDLSANVETD